MAERGGYVKGCQCYKFEKFCPSEWLCSRLLLAALTGDVCASVRLCCLQGKVSEITKRDVLYRESREGRIPAPINMKPLRHLKAMIFHKGESWSKC